MTRRLETAGHDFESVDRKVAYFCS